jgi:hypothetical protein
MPIVTVTAMAPSEEMVGRLLGRLAESVAEGASCSVDDVWCSFVPAQAQSVGERVATPADQCPIVIIRGRKRSDGHVAAAMAAAAQTVGAEIGLPVEDVWVQWIDVQAGHAFAGGGVVG